jgi:hypothetical protein
MYETFRGFLFSSVLVSAEHDECMNNFGSKPEEKRSVEKFGGVLENNIKVQFRQVRYGTVA